MASILKTKRFLFIDLDFIKLTIMTFPKRRCTVYPNLCYFPDKIANRYLNMSKNVISLTKEMQ